VVQCRVCKYESEGQVRIRIILLASKPKSTFAEGSTMAWTDLHDSLRLLRMSDRKHEGHVRYRLGEVFKTRVNINRPGTSKSSHAESKVKVRLLPRPIVCREGRLFLFEQARCNPPCILSGFVTPSLEYYSEVAPATARCSPTTARGISSLYDGLVVHGGYRQV